MFITEPQPQLKWVSMKEEVEPPNKGFQADTGNEGICKKLGVIKVE